MNITTVALSDFSPCKPMVRPVMVSGNVKSGAIVPSGIMVDGVAAMRFLLGFKE
jgi:hypothetical protein